jgi:Tol biopolymer transport system component
MSTKQADGSWGTPAAITAANTSHKESGPFLSANRLTLYFYSDRDGTDDLFAATRSDNDADFMTVTKLGDDLNTSDGDEANPWVSDDERHIMFSRGNTLFEASR